VVATTAAIRRAKLQSNRDLKEYWSSIIFKTRMPIRLNTKTRTDPLCPVCMQEKETSYHFPGTCAAIMLMAYSFFGTYIIHPEDIHHFRPFFLQLATASKRFFDWWFNQESALSQWRR